MFDWARTKKKTREKAAAASQQIAKEIRLSKKSESKYVVEPTSTSQVSFARSDVYYFTTILILISFMAKLDLPPIQQSSSFTRCCSDPSAAVALYDDFTS